MISVIIPTRNAEEHIHGLLTSLKGQSVSCEVIVIDSSSSDCTIRIADSFNVKTKIIIKRSFDHGGTRNLAVTKATGDIIVFLTQDAMPADRYFLEQLIKPLENPGRHACRQIFP
jgi:rhamnosyltransferase